MLGPCAAKRLRNDLGATDVKYQTVKMLSFIGVLAVTGIVVGIIGVFIGISPLLTILSGGIMGGIVGWKWNGWFKAIVLKLLQL